MHILNRKGFLSVPLLYLVVTLPELTILGAQIPVGFLDRALYVFAFGCFMLVTSGLVDLRTSKGGAEGKKAPTLDQLTCIQNLLGIALALVWVLSPVSLVLVVALSMCLPW